MTTTEEIPVRQILAAAQFAQLTFLFLVVIGYLALSLAGGFRRNWPQLLTFILLLAVTIILPTITTEASADRQAIFDIPGVPTLSGTGAVRTLLVADLIAVFALVAVSGGSVSSCFSPLYFLMPTLTILLLRHEHLFIQSYIWFVSALFLISAFVHRRYLTEQRRVLRYNTAENVAAEIPELALANKIACAIISLLCFLLSINISNRTAQAMPSGPDQQSHIARP